MIRGSSGQCILNIVNQLLPATVCSQLLSLPAGAFGAKYVIGTICISKHTSDGKYRAEQEIPLVIWCHMGFVRRADAGADTPGAKARSSGGKRG